MSLLSRFIDSLHIYFDRASYWEVARPVQIVGGTERRNHIILLEQGEMTVGRNAQKVQPNSFYFFPAGQPIFVNYGAGTQVPMSAADFSRREERMESFHAISGLSDFSRKKEVIVSVYFDVLIFDAIPFFETMGMPPFPLTPDREFEHLIRFIALENEQSKLGRDKIIKNYMEEIIIHMCRYIDSQPQFKSYIDRLEFLSDRRLADIVKYIQENLSSDLTNKVLAGVAYVSDDYVGQFFKSLTGKNLQEYIEEQRLQKAVYLLQTRPDSVQEISRSVGFKDPAYFSRRFKMRFGCNANSMRVAKS